MKVDPNAVRAGVEKSFSWLNWLTVATLAFSFSATLFRYFGGGSVSFLGSSIPVETTYFAFIAFTALHLFILNHIVSSCWDAWKNLSTEERVGVYDSLVRNGGIMIKDTESYRDRMYVDASGELRLGTSTKESPVWVHMTLVLLSLTALVEFEWSIWTVFQLSFWFALMSINWKIGANYLMALADLGRDSDESVYFANEEKGARLISTASGFWLGENVDARKYSVSSVMETMFTTLFVFLFLGAIFGLTTLVVSFFRAILF